MENSQHVLELLAEAKKLAQKFYAATGKPLGITGEVAEYDAARVLNLQLTPARQAGYDAIEYSNGLLRKVQIKGRCLPEKYKPGQRLGSIKIYCEWDCVLLVIMNHSFEAIEIWEAEREPIVVALSAPGSKARNERGSLPISKFKSIGRKRWSLPV